jgi:hypothetical protein
MTGCEIIGTKACDKEKILEDIKVTKVKKHHDKLLTWR